MPFPLLKLIEWLTIYKYFILFPLVVIEGPIVMVITGFLSSTGQLNFFIAYLVIIIGDVVGDSIYYSIGRWGGPQFIGRWGHYIGLNLDHIKKLEYHYDRHTAKTIILGKLAYSMEVPFLIASGLAKVPFLKFMFYVFIPTIPKSLLFVLIGYYFLIQILYPLIYLSVYGF